jgi:hypothetical protein
LSCCGSIGVEDCVFAKWVCLFFVVVYVSYFSVKVLICVGFYLDQAEIVFFSADIDCYLRDCVIYGFWF